MKQTSQKDEREQQREIWLAKPILSLFLSPPLPLYLL